jgi:hypothetical protein
MTFEGGNSRLTRNVGKPTTDMRCVIFQKNLGLTSFFEKNECYVPTQMPAPSQGIWVVDR